MRYLIALVVVLGLQLASGVASASTHYVANRELAWAQCRADAVGRPPNGSHLVKCTTNYSNNAGAGHARVADCLTNSPYTETASCWASPYNEYDWPTANGGCPVGTVWNEPTKTCFDRDKCLAKPALGFTKVHAASPYDYVCSEGCQFANNGALDIQFPNADGTVDGFTTGWVPSGEACAAGDPSPSPGTPPQECRPAPAGQTFCIKPNGDHCYSASTGRQICWRPGQTGEKSDGDILQQRAAGDAAGAPPPQTPPPPGDSFEERGSPQEVSETVNGVGIGTVVINYGTTSGTNAGGSAIDQGENADGSSGASGGNSGSGSSGDDGGLNCDGCDTSDGSAGHEGDSLWGEDESGTLDADESGFGLGSSCPAPPTVLGHELDLSAFCTIMGYIGLLVLAAAHVHAAYIMVGD